LLNRELDAIVLLPSPPKRDPPTGAFPNKLPLLFVVFPKSEPGLDSPSFLLPPKRLPEPFVLFPNKDPPVLASEVGFPNKLPGAGALPPKRPVPSVLGADELKLPKRLP